jgi:hypothetical protein
MVKLNMIESQLGELPRDGVHSHQPEIEVRTDVLRGEARIPSQSYWNYGKAMRPLQRPTRYIYFTAWAGE